MLRIKKIYYWCGVVAMVILAVGLGAGYALGFYFEHQNLVEKLSLIHPIRDHNSAYKFVDPLLAYVIPAADQDSQMLSLQKKINDIIGGQKKDGNITDASAFFYDLNRGRWIGVNENAQYPPASMLKVVIMVAYLKDSEKDSTILKKKLKYTQELQDALVKDQFNSESSLQLNSYYSVDDLIERMIVDSDNGAQYLLLDNVNKASLDYIYNALNISNPATTNGTFTISPRGYSLFFRILYSATYLNSEDSEKALEILSRATFNDGLRSDLPDTVSISHKFGEYVSAQAGQIQGIELHDCGIIYYTENPYFLCVMTKGPNLDQLKTTIQNISSLVYKNYQ